MTIKKDLKKRVRERQLCTGESYTTARGQVLAQRRLAQLYHFKSPRPKLPLWSGTRTEPILLAVGA